MENQKLRLERVTGCVVTLGQASLCYKEKKKLTVFGGLVVGEQTIPGLKSLGSQGLGQRQGGPEHDGKDETLTK